MCLMASANHLLTIFLGVEMASVPSYALAGMLKGRPRSSEAALKYSVYGAGAAGIMLYGISLLAGVLGTCHLPTMAERLGGTDFASGQLADHSDGAGPRRVDDRRRAGVQALGLPVPLLVPRRVRRGHGRGERVFKRGFQSGGAGAVGSRGGRIYDAFSRQSVRHSHCPAACSDSTTDQSTSKTAAESTIKPVSFAAVDAPAEAKDSPPKDPLSPVRSFIALLIALIAAVTCTFGNLAAYGQTNIKRLMAYSTIAHAGYIMMPVAAAVALSGTNPAASERRIRRCHFTSACTCS